MFAGHGVFFHHGSHLLHVTVRTFCGDGRQPPKNDTQPFCFLLLLLPRLLFDCLFFHRNGEGTCRKSHPGPFAYIKTTTEQQCSDVDTATEIIQNQDECEVAAVLAGETAKSCSSRGQFTASCVKLTGYLGPNGLRPPGCAWDSSYGVRFNKAYDSRQYCATTTYSDEGCLCKASAYCVHQVCLLLWY